MFKITYGAATLAFLMLLAYRLALLLSPRPSLGLTGLLLLCCAGVFVLLSLREKRLGRREGLWLTAALYCLYGLCLYTQSGKSLIWLFAAAGCFFLMRFALERESGKAAAFWAFVLGLLFALLVFVGAQLEVYGRLELLYSLDDGLFVLRGLLALAGSALFLTAVLHLVFSHLAERAAVSGEGPAPLIKKRGLRLAAMTALILLCWLPCFVAFYPGCLSPDSLLELEQQLGLAPLSNHHPYLHQLMIRLCLGLCPGSVEGGVAVYTGLQQLILAFSFALAVELLGSMGVHRAICRGVLAFFALFTVNAFYSVTMWKDVVHGAATLLFVLLLIREGLSGPGEERKAGMLRSLALVAAAFFFCTLRNNGWYAFLLGFPVYIVLLRRSWKRLGLVFLSVLLLVSGYNHLIFDVMGIKKSASAEVLSVPLQQIARVVKLNPEELQSREFAEIEDMFIEPEGLGERYRSYISDPVKAPESFRSELFAQTPGRFVKSWIGLGLRHPVTYVEAFLLQCYGYWYPDVSYWTAHNAIEDNELGLSQREENFSMRHQLSMLHQDLSEKLPTAFVYSLGLMAWLLLICVVLLCLKGWGRLAAPTVILAMFWLTTLASPVYCEYRYLYGFVLCVPVYLGLAAGLGKKD